MWDSICVIFKPLNVNVLSSVLHCNLIKKEAKNPYFRLIKFFDLIASPLLLVLNFIIYVPSIFFLMMFLLCLSIFLKKARILIQYLCSLLNLPASTRALPLDCDFDFTSDKYKHQTDGKLGNTCGWPHVRCRGLKRSIDSPSDLRRNYVKLRITSLTLKQSSLYTRLLALQLVHLD